VDQGGIVTEQAEIDRRYRLVREAAERDGLDAVIVAGSEYTGFEGGVLYLSGFTILHRYAYVLLPLAEQPTIVFPREARYVGEHGECWIEDRVFAELPGTWLRDRIRERGWKRVGIYGLDYVMTVRDYRELAEGEAELVSWDSGFDYARAVKSEAELASVRESMKINEDGFWVFLEAYEPGKTEAEMLAPAEALFVERGCKRGTMNMVLVGPDGGAEPEFKFASATHRVNPSDLLLPGLEIAGPGGHWVEFSRPIIAGRPNDDTRRMLEAYHEYFDAASATLKAGATAEDVHRAVSKGFVERGFQLGHVTGHSIGMTMIEYPRIGAGVDAVLQENMVCSMHPHAISPDGRSCLYMQDSWLVTKDGGVPLSQVPIRLFDGSETRSDF
jgi:Xaa-Pro aminopeptidase